MCELPLVWFIKFNWIVMAILIFSSVNNWNNNTLVNFLNEKTCSASIEAWNSWLTMILWFSFFQDIDCFYSHDPALVNLSLKPLGENNVQENTSFTQTYSFSPTWQIFVVFFPSPTCSIVHVWGSRRQLALEDIAGLALISFAFLNGINANSSSIPSFPGYK